MSKTFEELIDDIKESRKIGAKEGGPWIYEDGKIADNVVICDIIPILEDLKEYEIEMSDEEIMKFREGAENFYSYNNGAKIDTDFSVWYKEGDTHGLFCIHTGRNDAREGFSEYVPFETDKGNALDLVFAMEHINQTVDISDRYAADLTAVSDSYTVRDIETDEEVLTSTELSAEDVLKEIEEAEIER
jgi:hypothetical protein